VAENFPITLDQFSYRRSTLFAVELLDPVTLTPVSEGVKVQAVGLSREPIVNYSGRFVWLTEGESWPTHVKLELGELPFEPMPDQAAKPKPPDLKKAKDDERFMRIVLQPKRTYPFSVGDGVLVVRGRVVEDATVDPPVPVPGVEVWLAWHDDGTGAWNRAPIRGKTDSNGEFVTFLRLLPDASPIVDAAGGMFVVIQMERAEIRETLPFAIPQGQVDQTFRTVDWNVLQLAPP
jgi:hypothetical protein